MIRAWVVNVTPLFFSWVFALELVDGWPKGSVRGSKVMVKGTLESGRGRTLVEANAVFVVPVER